MTVSERTGKCLLRVHLYIERRRRRRRGPFIRLHLCMFHVDSHTVCPRARGLLPLRRRRRRSRAANTPLFLTTAERPGEIKRRAHHIAFVATFPQHVFHSHAPCLPPSLPSIHPPVLPSTDVCTYAHTQLSPSLCLQSLPPPFYPSVCSLLRFPFSPRGRTNAQSSLSLSLAKSSSAV